MAKAFIPNPVLIVPCGMETELVAICNEMKWSINCTLRNGNIDYVVPDHPYS